MRATTIPRFGEPDVLEVADVAIPEPGPGQVAIDVAFAGANYAEVLFRRGVVDVSLPYVPGSEVSGHVRAVGDGALRVDVRERLPLERAVEAHRLIESGGSTGKVVLAV